MTPPGESGGGGSDLKRGGGGLKISRGQGFYLPDRMHHIFISLHKAISRPEAMGGIVSRTWDNRATKGHRARRTASWHSSGARAIAASTGGRQVGDPSKVFDRSIVLAQVMRLVSNPGLTRDFLNRRITI